MSTETTSNDWRDRSFEFPSRFEDWLEAVADPGLSYCEQEVQRHAWHLAENIYAYGCRWCAVGSDGAL